MAGPLSVSCPHCEATLKLRSTGSIGKRVACPRCGEMFVVRRPAKSDDDFPELDDSKFFTDDSGSEEFPTPAAPRRRSKSHRVHSSGKPPSRSQSRSLLAGTALAALLVVLVIVVAASRNAPDPAHPAARQVGGGLPVAAADGPLPAVLPLPVVSPSAPITDEEARQFAAAVEKAAVAGDAGMLSSLINPGLIADRAMAGLEAPDAARRGFRDGVTRSSDLARQIAELVAKGGSYRLLRIGQQGPDRRALFRLTMGETGFNYHDLVLGRTALGEVRAADVYVYTTGELMSQTLRRAFLPLAVHASRGLLDRLSGNESEYIRSLPQLKQMTESLARGDAHSALTSYRSLPATLRQDKSVLMLRFRAAQAAGNDAEYLAALEDFRTHHPGDPATDVISIDYFLLREHFAEALGCVDRLDATVGGDPFLGVMRAHVYLLQKKPDLARETALKVIEVDPSLREPYRFLITASMIFRDHDETIRLLQQWEAQFQTRIDDLTQVGNFSTLPQYPQFLQSSQYRNWKSRPSTDGT